MLVSTVHNHWDEESARQRIICTPEEARTYLGNPAFVQVLDRALEQMMINN